MREVAVFHKESHNGVALVKLGGNIPHQVIHYLVVLAHAFHSNREPLVIALGILPDEHMLGMPNIRRVSSNVDKGVPLYGGINHIVGIADAAGAGNILETVALKNDPPGVLHIHRGVRRIYNIIPAVMPVAVVCEFPVQAQALYAAVANGVQAVFRIVDDLQVVIIIAELNPAELNIFHPLAGRLTVDPHEAFRLRNHKFHFIDIGSLGRIIV